MPSVSELIRAGVAQILAGEEKVSENKGSWSYEGVYRSQDGQIPLGYRVGGTAIACTALLYCGDVKDIKITSAIERGAEFILSQLGDPLLAPDTKNAYDVRIWGHACALEFFSHLKLRNRAGKHAKEIEEWMPKLVQTIATEEIAGGGWNYAHHTSSATFVTAPVALSLLYARDAGATLPAGLLDRARDLLDRCRLESGAFVYDEQTLKLKVPESKSRLAAIEQVDRTARLPGAIGRSPASESALALLGKSDAARLAKSVHNFYEYWDELEKRRAKTGTHVGEFGIAPYYFYYAHRYAAMAIELMPAAERAAERARLLQFIMRTRDDSGGWNDRHFPRSRSYGTAMVILSLLGERQPIPAASNAKKR